LQKGAPAAGRRREKLFEIFDNNGRCGHERFIACLSGENNALLDGLRRPAGLFAEGWRGTGYSR
jgi:hypothetical protein